MTPGKKKTYVAVIGCLALALTVDRLVLTDSATLPPSAEAMPPESNGGLPGLEPLPKCQIPSVPFPKHIPTFGEGFVLRDVFVKPQGSRDSSPDGVDTHTVAERLANGQPLSRGEFATHHTLGAVFSDDGLKIAVVDGKWLRIGQSVSGCRLIGVDGSKARFQCYDGESRLEISDPIPPH